MKPLPFTGVPKLRPAALPTRRAVFIGGRLRRPRTGLDMLLFGVALSRATSSGNANCA
jgi:hypothetical protein